MKIINGFLCLLIAILIFFKPLDITQIRLLMVVIYIHLAIMHFKNN